MTSPCLQQHNSVVLLRFLNHNFKTLFTGNFLQKVYGHKKSLKIKTLVINVCFELNLSAYFMMKLSLSYLSMVFIYIWVSFQIERCFSGTKSSALVKQQGMI